MAQTPPTQRSSIPDAAVMLPCTQDQFREFISSLLGRPQTITKTINGAFSLDRTDLESLHHLVTQRVAQQNHGTLLQFTIRIVFSDGSTVLLNSLEEFRHYTEIRPVVSMGAHLTWTFLVQFPDKQFPEKQDVQISILTASRSIKIDDDAGLHFFSSGPTVGIFSLRISHTARTWGADIESMFTAQIQTLLKAVPAWKKWVNRHSGWIALGVGVTFAMASLGAAFVSSQRFAASQATKARAVLEGITPGVGDVQPKIDYILQSVVAGDWPRHLFYTGVFLVLSFIVAIVLGAWAGSSAENPEPSFLLLSRESEKAREQELRGLRRRWCQFALSVVVSVITSVIGNYLFFRLQG